MSRKRFSAEDRARLMKNGNVLKVGEAFLTYCPAFKVEAVRQYLAGKTPQRIFQDAGFDLDLIGRKTPKRQLLAWRTVFEQRGEAGLMIDRRGRHSTGGRRSDRELTVDERLRRAEARVRYLEKENELLKKFDAIERSVADRPYEKYALILDLVTSAGNEFSVRYLCELAEVSRSGYYRWLATAPQRRQREQEDHEQYLLIKEIFLKRRRTAGWRTIRMILERRHGVVMNHKKIRRLMRKYQLVTVIRRKCPYRQIAKATQTHKTLPNVLNRQFIQRTPYKVFGTDITYLYDGSGQRAYLSVLRDLASGEIVARRVANTLTMDLSGDLIKQVTARLGKEGLRGVLIHSDQGFHYTHPQYVKQLADLGVVQSMSRKGNCLDNAPVESFFGHMKDELDLSGCHSLEQVRAAVDEYLHYYNHSRYQWDRKKMAPVEYRNHLLAS